MKKFFTLFILLCSQGIWAFSLTLIETIPSHTDYTQDQTQRSDSALLNLINHAQSHIEIGALYFKTAPHSAMADLIDALQKAEERGVHIRILLDKSFAKQSAPALTELKNRANIEIRYLDVRRLAGGVLHAKYMLVDNRWSFVGSQNFDWKALEENHELGAVIDDTALHDTLEQLFFLDWQLSQAKELKTAHNIVRTFNNGSVVTDTDPLQQNDLTLYPAFTPEKLLPKKFTWELPCLLTLINNAKKTINIQLYQYSDLTGKQLKQHWRLLDNALLAAAQRGVSVHIVVSNAMLKTAAWPAMQKVFEGQKNLTLEMNSIPDYTWSNGSFRRVQHTKFMIIDHAILWLGTGNWSKSYFYKTRDIALIIHNQALATQAENIFEHHEQSHPRE